MSGESDDQNLSVFFEASGEAIEELMTRAIHAGQRVRDLAIVLERKFNGEVVGRCMSRGAVDAHLRDVPGVDSGARRRIVSAVNNAVASEVPAVLLVHGEGFISVGIRRMTGKPTWLS